MSQLQLFRQDRAEPARRAPDLAYVRKSLYRLLRTARDAEIMPWSDGEAASRAKQFPELAALLPLEESGPLISAFQSELTRLRSTT